MRMKRRSSNLVCSHALIVAPVLVSLAFFACSTAKPAWEPALDPTGRADYDALLALFKKQASTPQAESYDARGTEQTSSNLMDVLMSCTKVGPDAEWPQMTMILKIDEGGVVQDARADSDSRLAACVETKWRGMRYDPPPFSPFYKMVTLDAHSPGGV